MASISTWLLSIAGVVILGVLAEFVLPEGQMNKYTKVIFSFVILLVIILPLPKIFGKDFDFSKYSGESEEILQEDYLEQINLDKLTEISESINKQIEESGIRNVEVSINANIFGKELEIYNIYVDLEDIAYGENFPTKNITNAKAKILEIIGDYVQLDDVEVRFNE